MSDGGLRHSWTLTPRQAVALQKRLRAHIRTHLKVDKPKRVAGVDVAYLAHSQQSVAAAVVLDWPLLETLETAVARIATPFPYVPGLLSFREMPAILKALGKLSHPPDLILVDGHGQAHPRRMGIASHLGLWLGQPTIGIGKSRLCGQFQEPALSRGSATRLVHQGEVIGRVVRTRSAVRPIFVSVGYGLPLTECVRWTLAVTRRFRLPEPIRRADHLSKAAKTAFRISTAPADV